MELEGRTLLSEILMQEFLSFEIQTTKHVRESKKNENGESASLALAQP